MRRVSDGALFHPGTDELFASDSLGVGGPIASLRLEYWRRGIQNADCIPLARRQRADSIERRATPRAPSVKVTPGT